MHLFSPNRQPAVDILLPRRYTGRTKDIHRRLDPRFQACILAAKCGSISEAANALYLSNQAVKKQIDSLESELGFPLFTRSSKGLALTAAGKVYVDGIEKLTSQHAQLLNRCRCTDRQGRQKSLIILLPSHPKIYFEEALLAYSERYPEVAIHLSDTRSLMVLYNNTARLRTLTDGITDIVLAPFEPKHDKERLDFYKLNSLHYNCVMKPGHPLSGKETVSREDLSPWPVRINTVMDRNLYDHIMDQDISRLPESIVCDEKEPSGVPSILSFCMNGGIFITKGNYLETLHPLIARPFFPDFTLENGLYCRKDPPAHVLRFIELALRAADRSPSTFD